MERCEASPRAVLLAIAAVTVISGVYVTRNFAVDSDLSKLIRPSGSLAWYRANEAYKAQFPELQQTSIVVVSGRDPEAVDRTAARIVSAFSADAMFEFVFAPALDPMLRDHRAYFLTLDDLEAWVRGVQYDYGAMLRLADGAGLANAAFTLADQIAATSGLRLPTSLATLAASFQDGVPVALTLEAYPHLVPPAGDEHYLIVMLKGRQANEERLPNAAQVERIRAHMDATVLDAGVRVRLTGEVPLAHEEISAALDGIGIAGVISLVLLALVLRLGVRSWRILTAAFCLLGVGVVWTLAWAGLVVGAFNTLALIFVVMFFGIGVDFAVHFSLRLWETMEPGSTEDPEVHAAREIGPALGLCMLTSSIAFLSFVPTDYRGLAELGIISAGGMLIAFVLTLSLLPAFFSLFGMPPRTPGPSDPPRSGARRSPVTVLLVTGLIAGGAGWIAKDLTFDYNVLALRDADTEAMSTLLELQASGVTTDYSINVLAADATDAGRVKNALSALEETGEIVTPEDLVPVEQEEKRRLLDELSRLLDTIGPVAAADREFAGEALEEAVAYLKEVRASVSAGDRALLESFTLGLAALTADPGKLAALDASLESALKAELDALRRIVEARPFTLDGVPAAIRARLVTADGRHLVTVLPAAPLADRTAADAFVRSVLAVTPDVGGRAVVEWGVGDVAVRAFIEAALLAVAAIAVLLVAYFRGLLLPLVVLTPLALTTVITFALIELTGLTLNMANILVVPLIFGLGVDTGIHVVHRFNVTGSVAALLRSSTARAVVISALTTIGTFFSLSFSPHKGAASVGMLLTIAITVMLIATFAVVPALLQVLGQRPGAQLERITRTLG